VNCKISNLNSALLPPILRQPQFCHRPRLWQARQPIPDAQVTPSCFKNFRIAISLAVMSSRWSLLIVIPIIIALLNQAFQFWSFTR
jgi:hypothetical protein